MKNRPVFLGLVCVVTIVMGGGPASINASPIIGPELTISNKDQNQYNPRVAYNSVDDEYLVVWEERLPSMIHEIWGRRIGGDGTVHPGFAIAAGDASHRVNPDVAYDPVQNRYLVVYTKELGSGVTNIWSRLVPPLGPDPLVVEKYVGLSSDYQDHPAVVYGRGAVVAEKFLVVWIEGVTPPQVNAAFVDGAGGDADNQFAVTVSATACDDPEIAYNRNRSEFLVTFLKDNELKGKILNATGNAVHGGAFTIRGAASGNVVNNGGVDAYFPDDRYLASFEIEPSPDSDIGAQWVNGDATLLGGGLPIPDAGLDQKNPDVACVKNTGHCLIVWARQYTSTVGPLGLWAALAPSSGGLQSAIEIIEPSPGDDFRDDPSVAAGELPFFISWEHDRDNSLYLDIHGRLASPMIFIDLFESGNTSAWSSVVR